MITPSFYSKTLSPSLFLVIFTFIAMNFYHHNLFLLAWKGTETKLRELTTVYTDIEKMALKSSISYIGSTTGVRLLSLSSLSHISFICTSIEDSNKFYQDVLGFVLVKRPKSLGFDGAW